MAYGARAPHPDEVLKSALAAQPAPVVVLTGGLDRAGVESWYVDEALARLTGKLLGSGGKKGEDSRAFNHDRLRAEEASGEVAVARAETLPVMAPHRVVAVSDVERWKAADQEKILAYLKRPAKTTVLLLASTKLDRRLALTKALEAGGKDVQLWRFRKLEAPELVRVLVARAKSMGKRLTPAAAEEMVRRAGEDLRLQLTELDKLVAFVGNDRDEIHEDDVLEATAGAGMSDVFAYADALGRGDLSSSLERLRIILEGGASAYELIGGLAWHFRTMLKAKGAGAPAFGRRQQEIAAAAKAFPTRALLSAHREIYRADVTLKSAQGPTGLKDDAVMDRLTRRICALRAAGRR